MSAHMSTTIEPTDTAITAHRPSVRLRFAVAFLVGLIVALGLGAGALY